MLLSTQKCKFTTLFKILQKAWLAWSFVTSFAVPTSIIIFIWIIMAHWFVTNNAKGNRCSSTRYLTVYHLFFLSVLRNVTLKIASITAIFIASIVPFCIQNVKAILETPTITLHLDKSIIWALLNSLVQPVLCLLVITQIREEFIRIVCCRPNRTSERQQSLRRQSTRSKTLVTDLAEETEEAL